MKIALTALFAVASLLLIYFLADSIRRPVDFRETWAERNLVVQAQLEEIAELQKMYKVLNGDTLFADSFEALEKSILTDSFYILRIEGDPFDTTIVADTTEMMYAARDSFINYLAGKEVVDKAELSKLQTAALDKMENWSDTSVDVRTDADISAYLDFCEKNISSYFNTVRYVPFSDKEEEGKFKEFMIASGEIAMEGRRAFGRTVPTFEVGTTVGVYMHEYAVSEYGMYDPNFSHGNMVKVGDLMKSTTAGNW